MNIDHIADDLSRAYQDGYNAGYGDAFTEIASRPARGRWIDTEPDRPDWSHRKKGMAYYCSACLHPAGKNKHRTYKFCPWCGAKMEG